MDYKHTLSPSFSVSQEKETTEATETTLELQKI